MDDNNDSHPNSPDPLTLPSSPPSARPYTRRATRTATPGAVPHSSPSKSFLMDPGTLGDREQSPWRIRVTVQAEPKQSSPAKGRGQTRTRTVPLKGSSPSKQGEGEGGVKRVQRKRKGTPIARRTRSQKFARESPEDEDEAGPRAGAGTDEDDMMDSQPAHADTPTQEMQALPDSPTRQQIPSSEVRRRRQRMQPLRGTERYKRLSAARDELQLALDDAAGDYGEPAGSYVQDAVLGADANAGVSSDAVASEHDMTVANEDFTMISNESLASIKANTDANTSILSAGTGVDRSRLENGPPLPVANPEQRNASVFNPGNDSQSSISSREGSFLGVSREERRIMRQQERERRRAQDREKSKLSVSHVPSSPPKVAYPDITEQAVEARTPARHVDEMSWKPTGVARHHPMKHQQDPAMQPEYNDKDDEDEQEVQLGAQNPDAPEADDDIWAEEASRSLEDDPPAQAQEAAAPATTASIPPIFSDEPEPPRRSKLPKTWRRKSGHDFTYSDSPAHQHVESRKPSGEEGAETDAESRRSSGVLTPPSTDDEAGQKPVEIGEAEEEDEISGLTEPNAADTQLEAHHRQRQPALQQNQVTSPLSESSSSDPSPSEDGDDTGFFWQSNLPSVYQRQRPRPQRKKATDLSAILRMDSSKVEEDPSAADITGAGTCTSAADSPLRPTSKSDRPAAVAADSGYKFSPLRMRPVDGKVESSPMEHAQRQSGDKVLNSPLRKSLLRSSKMMDGRSHMSMQILGQSHQSVHVNRVQEAEVVDDSFASKASDQRQMLGELKIATPAPKRIAMVQEDPYSVVDGEELSYEDEEDYEEETTVQQSYEEKLNLDSPTKIAVNFNDSTLSHQQNSHLLAPRRTYEPLFTKDVNAQQTPAAKATAKLPPSITLVGKKAPSTHPNKPGQENENIFSRLSTTFWSAVARPLPYSPATTPPRTAQPGDFPAALRASLRSRYGVLSRVHPWTMLHMRTLHRLLNSVLSGRRDSIVPTYLPLPYNLAKLVNTQQRTATGFPFLFTAAHAHVTYAFLQLLVDPELVGQMQRGEVAWLGDRTSEMFRGAMGGRIGREMCFRTLPPKSETEVIDVAWVVGALGCCVKSNEETKVKRGRKAEMQTEMEDEVDEEDDGFEREEKLSVSGDGRGGERVKRWMREEREGRVELS